MSSFSIQSDRAHAPKTIEMNGMPKQAFTVMTVSTSLKDRLTTTSREIDLKRVPSLFEDMLDGAGDSASTRESF